MKEEKRCFKCKHTKQFSEFYKDQRNKDGLRSRCKSCVKAHQKAYQQTERGKAVMRKGIAKYSKTPKGKAAHCKATARRNARYPNYLKATNAVNNAITVGRLPRPDTRFCYYCGAKAEQYHHYLGYEPEHWLDIMPVCVECHRKKHRKIA